MSAPLTVGVDLDLTLVDSRPGMAAVLHELNAETGYRIDAKSVADHPGQPLDQLIAPWVPADDRDAIVARFRELYPDHAIAPTRELDGVRDALQAVRAHHGRIIVITGKFEANAALHLNHLGRPHDALVGAQWGDGKTQSLLEFGASVYVGDHPADLLSAKAADASEV